MVSQTSYICRDTLKNLHDATENIFYEILTIYIEDANKNINAMKEEISENNTEQLFRLAHTLKGSSMNVGAIVTAQLCEALENSLNNDQSNIESQVDLIRSAYEQSLPLLKEYLIN